MSSETPFRFRVRFAKTEAMRFTGHLDLFRTWERTFRRAGLPLVYSQGFHPKPRMHLAAALPLGCLSDGDLLDCWLTENLDPEDLAARLDSAAPPGIRIQGVHAVGVAEPALPRQVVAAHFEVRSAAFPSAEDLRRRVNGLLEASSLTRSRRGRSYDLRPLIGDLRFDAPSGALHMDLSAREGASGRADEVLLALGLDPAESVACRTRLVLAS
jgi:radical SAM-linked protein